MTIGYGTPMQLHRSRGFVYLGAILLLIGAAVLVLTDGFIFQAAGVLFVIGGLLQLYRGLRPFRFVIGPAGLDVRTRFGARELSWSQIQQLTVNADGILSATVLAPRGTDQTVRLLDLGELRESREEVLAALTADGRGHLLEAAEPSPQGRLAGKAFEIGLRGFDTAAVDALTVECEQAMALDDRPRARRAVESFQATPPVIVLRGYVRPEVELYVRHVEDWIAGGR